jgi:hypothetical protein
MFHCTLVCGICSRFNPADKLKGLLYYSETFLQAVYELTNRYRNR